MGVVDQSSTRSEEVEHNQTQGGTSGNPHSGSADVGHGNEQHSVSFVRGDFDVVENGNEGADQIDFKTQ